MVWLGDYYFEFRIAIVAAGAAAAEQAVIFRPISPIVPEGGMNEEQALAGVSEVEDLLADGRGSERGVVAQEEHVEIAQELRHVVGLSRGVHFDSRQRG